MSQDPCGCKDRLRHDMQSSHMSRYFPGYNAEHSPHTVVGRETFLIVTCKRLSVPQTEVTMMEIPLESERQIHGALEM